MFNILVTLTTGSEVIRITGPPAVPTGIPVTFTCRTMDNNDRIAWTIYYTSASGSTQSVSTVSTAVMGLMFTVANITTIYESTSELVLDTTNRSITSIECNVREVSGIARSSRNVVVFGKFCLIYRIIV